LAKKIIDAVEIAFELSDGLAILTEVKDPDFDFPVKPKKTSDKLFSRRFSCPDCQISLPPIKPRLFSFNSPLGACDTCKGLGVILKVDENKVPQAKIKQLKERYLQTQSDNLRKYLEKYMIRVTCSDCQGGRLAPEALSVLIGKKNIAQVVDLPLNEFCLWLDKTSKAFTDGKQKIAKLILDELKNRADFLISVGVDYLTLARDATTLSAGEAQRIRLASQLGTGLTGVLYILDEPTVGLHPRDTGRLVNTLERLRDLGNTVIVVEHDELVLQKANYLVEFGPGAGKKGGKVVATGTPEEIFSNKESLTGNYLSGRRQIEPAGRKIKLTDETRWMTVSGCKQHNLKDLEVKFPLGALTVVMGVSGSGKSTLVDKTLYPALMKAVYGYFYQDPGEYQKLTGANSAERVLVVDQSPIGRTSRSNPATYIGVFNDIRDLFAQTPEAKLRGFSKSHFSFNVKRSSRANEGRCPRCEGQGNIRVRMEFLPDVWVTCEECNGKRYKEAVLEVDYKDKNIADVLDLTIDEANDFFAHYPLISRKLKLLQEIGLGYLRLGQISPTLSGGESQRLKLARELVKRSNKRTIYLLDEPTTGLHFADLEKLLKVLRKLVDQGHTVIVIEHNPQVIKQADWLVELGPEGGNGGGYLIASGTPEEIKKNPKSLTGKYL
ncbi:MAG: excinuclease ABC subunit UvrA, partial [Patescibacteria group bacterium]